MAAAEEHRLDLRRERPAFELQLGENRVDIAAVLAAPAERGHEIAVPAPVRAEREMDVQM